jgi:FtsP/CotA-like multicopper oxidase with cupredoxin domain
MDRRAFIQGGSLVAGGALWLKGSDASAQAHTHQPPNANATQSATQRGTQSAQSAQTTASAQSAPYVQPRPTVVAPGGQLSVITPNGSTLPLRQVGNVKVGHLIAHEIEHEFAPGLRADCWGYNGQTPGPTIEAVEGDRVRIYVTNRLPEPTTLHWHGILLPNGMDGVSGLNQRPIQPGETFKYEFTFTRAGTYMYHPHYDEMTQMALGMVGMIVVHPRVARGPHVDRDFVLMSHEWKIRAGTRRPDPNAMSDFNVLTFNGKAFPGTAPLVVGRNERVRIRFGNLGPMDHHPIHLHGYYFKVTATDGGMIPESAQWPETTVLVAVGTTRTIEFVADAPGDWAMHCHMTHHVMNQMGHEFPVMVGANRQRIDRRVQPMVPAYMTMGHDGMGAMAEMGMPSPANSIPMRGGVGPFSSIDMGGMFTVLKVRDNPDAEDGSGWYQHPAGTVATLASSTDLATDGIIAHE